MHARQREWKTSAKFLTANYFTSISLEIPMQPLVTGAVVNFEIKAQAIYFVSLFSLLDLFCVHSCIIQCKSFAVFCKLFFSFRSFLNRVVYSDLFITAFLIAFMTYDLLFSRRVFFFSGACTSRTLLKVVLKLKWASSMFEVFPSSLYRKLICQMISYRCKL